MLFLYVYFISVFLGNDSYLLQDLEVVQNIVSAKSTNTQKLCQLKGFYLTQFMLKVCKNVDESVWLLWKSMHPVLKVSQYDLVLHTN